MAMKCSALHEGNSSQQNGAMEDRVLFDSQILLDLNFAKCSSTYNPPISPKNPGENLVLRSLRKSDYDLGFVELLRHLTVVGDISREQFEAKFDSMLELKDSYYIAVIEDRCRNLIIGAATLFVEHKFIHECALRGRIEDVVVSDDYRGKQLGKLLVDVMTLLSAHLGCYKVSLDCKDKMLPFYSRFGYVKEDGVNYMCRRWRIDK